jgi:hypothetical protein
MLAEPIERSDTMRNIRKYKILVLAAILNSALLPSAAQAADSPEGRERSLTLQSSQSHKVSTGWKRVKINHKIVFQGCKCPDMVRTAAKFCQDINRDYTFEIIEWDKNIGIGAGLNKIIPLCDAPLIFKMDDDCEIISRNFFSTALFVNSKFPQAIFSPQPIGLVNNMAGPPGHKREVIEDVETHKYHMVRHVNHVGGFARFCPAKIMKSFTFAPDLINGISGDEDGQLSQFALRANIPMIYVETGMVVEHMEGLGQQIRYPQYFANRTGDKETFKRWIT